MTHGVTNINKYQISTLSSGQNININKNLEEADSNFHAWLCGFQTSVEEVIADMKETVRESKLEVKHEDVTKLLHYHDTTQTGKELLLMNE